MTYFFASGSELRDEIEYWINRAKVINHELDYSKLNQNESKFLIYAASNLYEELEKAARLYK